MNDIRYEVLFHPIRDESSFNIVSLLKACARQKDIHKGFKIHAFIQKHEFLEKNCFVTSALINMYVRCCALVKAQQVLSKLPVRDVVMWNALIAGYAQQGKGEEALKCFDIMQREGHSPDAVTFTCALKACGSIGEPGKGEKIHDRILSLGMLKEDVVLGSALVDMYARCGALTKAQRVLEELPVRDVFTWTSLLAGYAQHGHGKEALKCFDGLQREGHAPNRVTFTCALKACANIGAASEGENVHEKIVSLGILKNSTVLGCALVDMYARCGALAKAQQVLEELSVQDTTTWTALISGYVQWGQGDEALLCFERMQFEGHFPDMVTFICALKACGNLRVTSKGQKIHDKIASLGMLENNVVLGNTLIDMYAKCHALVKAQEVLNKLPVRDVVTWNALIAGYAQQGQSDKALKCFHTMQHEGFSPDDVTFTCALKACADTGEVTKGEQIHHKTISLGMLEKNIVLGSALVDMYVKCAALPKALLVLSELPVQDVIMWNALIQGYAHYGQTAEALNCFGRMQSKGVGPDLTTMNCVLSACSHSGLLDQAEMHFAKMSTNYGILPDIEHYCCMVDLFCRAGQVNKALAVIEKMPCDEHLPLWHSLLGACSKWGDPMVARLAFKRALHVDESDASAYVGMANMYTTACLQEDASNISVLMGA